MYCRRCKHDLRSVGGLRCPECGSVFRPWDRSTWLASPREPLVRDLRIVGESLLIGVVSLLFLGLLLLLAGVIVSRAITG